MVSPVQPAAFRTRIYVVNNGQTIDEQLPFKALSVRVDNPGGMWVNFPDAQLTVQPFTVGWVARLPAWDVANITTIPPIGQTPLVSANTEPATVTYFDDDLPVSPGSVSISLQNNFASVTVSPVCPAYGTQVTNLTFPANSVLVNNPGGQWVTITSGAFVYTVPPWTSDVVIVLPVASKSFIISTTPPTGQVNTGAGSCANVVFTEQILPASSGLSIQNLANSFNNFIQSIAPNTADTGSTIPLAFTANSILIDNDGATWLLIHDGATFRSVPPWTVGVVIPCPRGVTVARYASNLPPSSQVNRAFGNNATAEYTEQVLPSSSGIAVGPPGNAYTASLLQIAQGAPDNAPGVALGFTANSIVIDNPSATWALAHDGITFRFVPPWVTGMVIPCPQGITRGRVSANNPPSGQINLPNGTLLTNLIYTEQVLPASPGIQNASVLQRSSGSNNGSSILVIGPAAAQAFLDLVFPLAAGTWYVRFVEISCIDTVGTFPASTISVAASVNLTGNFPQLNTAGFIGPSADGALKVVRDYGNALLITTTAGASITYRVQNQAGGNYAINSLIAYGWIFLQATPS